MQGRNTNISVDVLNSSSDDNPSYLGVIELDPCMKIEAIYKKIHSLFNESENVLEELEVSFEGKGEKILLEPYKEVTFEELGVLSCSEGAGASSSSAPSPAYVLKVKLPKKMSLCVQEVIEDDLSLGASASPTIGEGCANGKGIDEFYAQLPSPLRYNEYRNSWPDKQHRNQSQQHQQQQQQHHHHQQQQQPQLQLQQHFSSDNAKYVGLVNQAMTCYLNSLLQALYMTPEFRNALYNWEFDGQNESRSIPFQLQKLFLNLQTSSKSAVETTDLTTSFGWQGSDAWQQHDIQELCRVMFDALEQKFKDTKQSNLINDLYEGKMLDYVRCLECRTEKSREDTFLDIPLPVRPFGSQVAYNSVEEALRAFVQPETLDGNNQYFCEKCDKKCNAHKGLKFTKFPYLLTLHLKRFDFDYTTLHRIKLNDKVVFPELLNLNSFVQNNNANSTDCCVDEQIEEKDSMTKYDDCCTTDSGSALEDEGCQSADASSTVNGLDVNCSESDEGIDVSSGNNHKIDVKGPYMYDLFSIMIHSGSASGGHYYAYIKDFEKQQWYCFNDQSVTSITEDDIRKTYGGNPHRGYYSGAYSSSTNAYMLMYRQIDKDRNTRAIASEDLPLHIRDLLKTMREKEELDRVKREKENDLIKLNVYCRHPIEGVQMDAKISVYVDYTLRDTVEYAAYQRFKLEGVVDKADCRLVKYNRAEDLIERSFASDDLKFCEIGAQGDCNFTWNDWFLEIRQPNTEWQVYKPGAVNMMVYPINVHSEELNEPSVIRVNENETVGELKRKLSALLRRPWETMKVVMEKYNDLNCLENDEETVNSECRNMECRLYVATDNAASVMDEDNDDNDGSFRRSKLSKFIEKIRHVIALNVHLPAVDIGTLESLSIPLLDANQNLESGAHLTAGAASGDSNSPPGSNVATSSPQRGGGVGVSATGNAICCGGDGFGDQSNSEDSSLSDSDRTLVGDAPGESMGVSSNSSNSPADQHMISPSDPADDNYNYDFFSNAAAAAPASATASTSAAEEMHWDDDETEEARALASLHFKVISVVEDEREVTESRPYNRVCKILVDKRTTLERLKRHLEQYVRVPVDYFKVYKQIMTLSIPTEDEWSNVNDTLKCLKDQDSLSVRLGRVLRKDEQSVHIHLLRPNHNEPITFLFEHVIAKGQTVGQVLKDIIARAKKKNMLDLNPNRCCLRNKSWKKPNKICLPTQVFGEDIQIAGGPVVLYGMFVQEIDIADKIVSETQTSFYVRRWRPSTLTLGPVQDVVVDTLAMDDLKRTVAQLGDIPFEHAEVALVKNNLPADMHRLEINDQDWKMTTQSVEDWPFLASDGSIFYYRDNREALKELTPEERKEINIQENKRLGLINSIKNFSPGKERALKIYLDTSPCKKDETCTD